MSNPNIPSTPDNHDDEEPGAYEWDDAWDDVLDTLEFEDEDEEDDEGEDF